MSHLSHLAFYIILPACHEKLPLPNAWMFLHIFTPSFYSIMYFLSGQRSLISITLRQNGINSPLTSLPGHRWQLSSANQMRCLGALWNHSHYRSHTCVQVCSPTSILSLAISLIHFLQKMISRWTLGLQKITNAQINYWMIMCNWKCRHLDTCHLHAYCQRRWTLGEKRDWLD